MRPDNLYQLPADLPVPEDDGAAQHLSGAAVASVPLPSTGGRRVRLDDPSVALAVVFCYPRTGQPDAEPLGGWAHWNSIPGARGCTPQACAYRDHLEEFRRLGAVVYGLSTQTTEYQREAVARLHLPFELLSDASGAFSEHMRLPSFDVAGVRLLKRLTLVIQHGRIVHSIYPVFPPDRDAETVINWLRDHAA